FFFMSRGCVGTYNCASDSGSGSDAHHGASQRCQAKLCLRQRSRNLCGSSSPRRTRTTPAPWIFGSLPLRAFGLDVGDLSRLGERDGTSTTTSPFLLRGASLAVV